MSGIGCHTNILKYSNKIVIKVKGNISDNYDAKFHGIYIHSPYS